MLVGVYISVCECVCVCVCVWGGAYVTRYVGYSAL